jgi:hypothetical protein
MIAMTRTVRPHVAPLAALLLAACQSADVGQECRMTLENADGTPIDVLVGDATCSSNRADFFRSGAIECDNLICLRSATGACAGGGTADPLQVRSYCSKACVSDADCFSDETGLVCRPVLLDPSFVATLPDGGAPWLPAALGSSYCATPALP